MTVAVMLTSVFGVVKRLTNYLQKHTVLYNEETEMEKLKSITASILMSLLVALTLSWVMVNFISGCGDNYHTSDGKLIAGECIAMPWVTYQGGELIGETHGHD